MDMDVDPSQPAQATPPSEAIDIPNPLGGAAPSKEKKGKKESAKVERPPGKSLLPTTKVQHIIKADKDITLIAKEATFLICCATEEFIKRFGEAAMALAERDKRSIVQYKDIATVVRKADEFLFLEEIIPWTLPEAPVKRKAKPSNIPAAAPTLLDQFVVKPADGAAEAIVNDDGTMQ
ncbi:hypothetical protein GGX14DRAFT_462390 [Mycena pura]|uniref:Transcription factor CBF/NF-Y/archaeal histone domain-containing protein n=1 Tax=Mycena pura TaxID=153505 RepID=A0AAD6YAR8_9AGAR|nr:hypothetical protein GGX14DRAFT_462390 [Mycena pura]